VAVALIVAAGSGERLGSNRPKAFVVVGGRPLLEWSVLALQSVVAVDRIVVALPEGCEAPDGTSGVRGGETRSHSVKFALAAAGARAGEAVVVHDAARPLAPPELFTATLTALDAAGADAAIAAAPVTDTIKRADDSRVVTETLDRSGLWAIQTPQAFRRSALEQALDTDDATLAAATDDAMLVEQNGGTVVVVPAAGENLKITTPVDLALAELLLAQRTLV
jgi:2-C-methyl-D-erythritol 4-phosphate cytidylyltransferase